MPIIDPYGNLGGSSTLTNPEMTRRVAVSAESALVVTSPSSAPMVVADQGKWYATDDTLRPWKHANYKPRVSAMPHLYDVAEGNLANHEAVRFIGYNRDVNNISEDIWIVGGTYVHPTAPMQMEVVSSSASDGVGGTGARTAMIVYLDTNYVEQMETITLNGQTPVNTVATNILRVNDFHVKSTGSGGFAAGNIDLRHLADTPIYRRIESGTNMSQAAVYTVPAGHTLYITSWHTSASSQASNHYTEFRLQATTDHMSQYLAGIYHVKDFVIIGYTATLHEFLLPIRCPEFTDVKVSAIADTSNAGMKVMTTVEGWIEE